MNSFNGTIDEVLEKCSNLSEEELNEIEADVNKSASISFIIEQSNCSEEEAEEVYQYFSELQVKKAIDNLLKIGEIKIDGYNSDNEPIYKLIKK